jgi:hypothetical protein
MRTLVLLLVLTFSIKLLLAQTSEPVEGISKGTKFIGGSFSFSTSKTEDSYQYTRVSIGPGMGFYFKDDLAVGGFLNYNYGKDDYPVTNSFSTSSGFGVTAFLLKNYMLLSNLFFTLQPQTSFGFTKQESNFSASYSGFDFSLGVSPGIMFFVGRKFALQTSIGNLSYSYNRRKPENISASTSTHSFGLNGALSISSFSIRYFLW